MKANQHHNINPYTNLPIFLRKEGRFQRKSHTIDLFSGFFSWMRNNTSVVCCCFSFGPQKFSKMTVNLHCHYSLVNLAILTYFWLYDRYLWYSGTKIHAYSLLFQFSREFSGKKEYKLLLCSSAWQFILEWSPYCNPIRLNTLWIIFPYFNSPNITSFNEIHF